MSSATSCWRPRPPTSSRRRASQSAGRPRLGHRRLSRRDAAPAARRAGAAHAGPRHRRAMVLDRPRGEDADRRSAARRRCCGRIRPCTCRSRSTGSRPASRRRIVVAAVDVGILNLTNYKPPSPNDYYLGQRALSADIRDLYGQLIDGMQGTRGQIRSGGDEGAQLQGSSADRPAGRALFRASSPSARTAPPKSPSTSRTSTARCASWRWRGARTKSARPRPTSPCAIRSCCRRRCRASCCPATVRRSISISTMSKAAPATTRIAVSAADAVMAGAGATQTLTLRAKERGSVNRADHRQRRRHRRGKGQRHRPGRLCARAQLTTLTVRSPAQILARRTVKPLAKGESLTLSSDMFADLVPGTGAFRSRSAPRPRSMRQAFSPRSTAIRTAARSRSRAARCRCFISAISRPRRMLRSTPRRRSAHPRHHRCAADAAGRHGSFGLWSAGGDDVWLDSYVTDFLTRAREHKFAVPETAFKLALDRLRNSRRRSHRSRQERRRRSRLCALCAGAQRRGADRRSALSRRRQARCAENADRQGADRRRARHGRRSGPRRARLCGGARRHSRRAAARSRRPRGLRLDAARCRGVGHARLRRRRQSRATVQAAVQRVEAARATLRPTSTQEDAWLLLAASAMAKDAGKVSLDVNGEAVTAVRSTAPLRPARSEGAAAHHQ